MRGNRETELGRVADSQKLGAADTQLRAALDDHRDARGDAVYGTFAHYLKVQADARRVFVPAHPSRTL